jgi:hypothetical protein
MFMLPAEAYFFAYYQIIVHALLFLLPLVCCLLCFPIVMLFCLYDEAGFIRWIHVADLALIIL